eukprot:761961-Hanusia_phi.AAC.6
MIRFWKVKRRNSAIAMPQQLPPLTSGIENDLSAAGVELLQKRRPRPDGKRMPPAEVVHFMKKISQLHESSVRDMSDIDEFTKASRVFALLT